MLSVKIANCDEISEEKVEPFTNVEESVTSLGLSTEYQGQGKYVRTSRKIGSYTSRIKTSYLFSLRELL